MSLRESSGAPLSHSRIHHRVPAVCKAVSICPSHTTVGETESQVIEKSEPTHSGSYDPHF